MSEFAEKIKNYYTRGMWSKSRVDKALELRRITEEEYGEIIDNNS